MVKIPNKDSNILGILIGFILPLVFFGALYLLNLAILKIFNLDIFMRDSILKLISIAINVFPIRYYFVKLKYDATGRGILLVTFVYVVVYFWVIT